MPEVEISNVPSKIDKLPKDDLQQDDVAADEQTPVTKDEESETDS